MKKALNLVLEASHTNFPFNSLEFSKHLTIMEGHNNVTTNGSRCCGLFFKKYSCCVLGESGVNF